MWPSIQTKSIKAQHVASARPSERRKARFFSASGSACQPILLGSDLEDMWGQRRFFVHCGVNMGQHVRRPPQSHLQSFAHLEHPRDLGLGLCLVSCEIHRSVQTSHNQRLQGILVCRGQALTARFGASLLGCKPCAGDCGYLTYAAASSRDSRGLTSAMQLPWVQRNLPS